jgi:TRAP-type C4-dicarboxylate transport system permease small subunit
MTSAESNWNKVLTPLSVINHAISSLGKNIAAALLAGMLFMILAQVIFRYVLNDSLTWTEELAKFSMVWVACLVAPWAYRHHLNVSIELFADALPLLLRQLSELIISLLIIAISGIFLLESIAFWQGGWTITASSMPIKLAYFYSCIPFAFGGILLVGIENLLRQLATLTGADLSIRVNQQEGQS